MSVNDRSYTIRLLVDEWQCMQLIRTSFALAALCYLPVATAGLEITSCMFSCGIVVSLQPMLANSIQHEHSHDDASYCFGIQVSIKLSLASPRVGRNQDSKSQDSLTFYLPQSCRMARAKEYCFTGQTKKCVRKTKPLE